MSFFGLTATIISLLALRWLKRTWDETKRSANAAERQLENDRAWVLFDRLTWAPVLAARGTNSDQLLPSGGMTFNLVLRNSGKTPAYAFRNQVDWKFVHLTEALPDFPTDAARQALLNAGGAIVAQGGEFVLQRQTMPANEYEKLKAGRLRVIFHCFALYHDLYHPELARETEICLEVRCIGLRRDHLGSEGPEFVVRAAQRNRAT